MSVSKLVFPKIVDIQLCTTGRQPLHLGEVTPEIESMREPIPPESDPPERASDPNVRKLLKSLRELRTAPSRRKPPPPRSPRQDKLVEMGAKLEWLQLVSILTVTKKYHINIMRYRNAETRSANNAVNTIIRVWKFSDKVRR